MPRFAVVQSDDSSDSDEGDEGNCTSTDDMSDASPDASDDDEHPLLSTVVEALEFAIRNVPIHGEHLRVANEALTNLRALSRVLFHQALSPRWSPAFVNVLRRARMVRVCFLMGDASAQLLHLGTRCRMCSAPEPRCQVALQLIGGDDGGVGCCEDMAQMCDAFDCQLDRDAELFATRKDDAFLGTYAGGRRCFDLAMAAVVARNLVSDTCYEICADLGVRLNDAGVREGLELDERDPTRALHVLTDVRDLTHRLAKRIQAVEDVLRGRPFPEAQYKQSGSAATWTQFNGAMYNRFCDTIGSEPLLYGAARAAASLRQPQQQPPPPQAADAESEVEEEEEEEAPVSSRTRASRQQHRQAAPVSSRTRRARRLA